MKRPSFLVVLFLVSMSLVIAACSAAKVLPTPVPKIQNTPTAIPAPTLSVPEQIGRSLSEGPNGIAASVVLWMIGLIPLLLSSVLGYYYNQSATQPSQDPPQPSQSPQPTYPPQLNTFFRKPGTSIGTVLMSSIAGILAGLVLFMTISALQDQAGILFGSNDYFPGVSGSLFILEIILFIVGVILGFILFLAIYTSITSRYIGIVNLVLIAASAIGLHNLQSPGLMSLITSYTAFGTLFGLLLHAVLQSDKLKRIFFPEFPAKK